MVSIGGNVHVDLNSNTGAALRFSHNVNTHGKVRHSVTLPPFMG